MPWQVENDDKRWRIQLIFSFQYQFCSLATWHIYLLYVFAFARDFAAICKNVGKHALNRNFHTCFKLLSNAASILSFLPNNMCYTIASANAYYAMASWEWWQAVRDTVDFLFSISICRPCYMTYLFTICLCFC